MENEELELQAQEESLGLEENVSDADDIIFTSEVTHNLPTRKEINKAYSQLNPSSSFREIIVGIMLVVLFVYLYLYQKNYVFYIRTYFVFALVYWGSAIFTAIRNYRGGAGYKRMLQSNGGKPIHNLITFTQKGVCVQNTDTERCSEYTYSQIRSIAHSKNFFLLFRDLNQCTVVSKESLTGGTKAEFLTFLRENCTNLITSKLRTNKLGIKIRCALLVLWAINLFFVVYLLLQLI